MGDVRHEGGTANLRRIEIGWPQAEIFTHAHRGHARLTGGNEQPVYIRQFQPTIFQRTMRRLPDQIEDRGVRRDQTQVRFRGRDNRRLAS